MMASSQSSFSNSRRYTTTSPRLAILALLLLFISGQALAASAVLGIDLGTEYIKAALVKPGIPLEIVLTKDSRRKQAAAIAFKPSNGQSSDTAHFPERLYGHDALAVSARYPSDVFQNLKPLLGLVPEGADALEAYSQRFPALDLVRNDQQGLRGIRSKSFGSGDGIFSVEELLAMELMSIKENAEDMAGKGHTIRDVVITIPVFYTAEERIALETAVELAGMKVIGLISDGLAVGLNYATSRSFPNVDKGENAEHHLIFDMGAGSTTATVLKFQARTVKDVGRRNKTIQEVSVVGSGWDRSLGGDSLNQLLVEDMVNRFVGSNAAKKASIDATSVKAHGRTMAKLWKESERIRMVLSANTQTSANFEGLHEDIDFRYKVTRTEFEALAATYAKKVTTPLTDALTLAGLTTKDLDSIILHGGLVRTPFIQTQLENIVSDSAKIKSNVNADESAVFGAAFKAAGLSPSFRVKEIRSNDVANYPMVLKWNADGKERQQKVFVPTSQVGAVKQLPFKVSTDFDITVNQITPRGGERTISNFSVTNITAAIDDLVTNFECERSAVTTTLSVRLSPVNGLFEFVDGSASCEVIVNPVKKGGVVDDVKGFFGFGGKKGEDENSTTEGSTASASSSAGQDQATGTSSSKKATSTPKAPKKKIQVNNFVIYSKASEQSTQAGEDLQRMKERLSAFDKSDQNRRLREEYFNKLEAFTYRTRDLLSDNEIIEVSTEAERSAIENQLSVTSEWLYTDGTSADLAGVKEKLQALRDLVEPVQKRKDEAVKRPLAIARLKETLNQTQSVIGVVRNSIESASSAAAAAVESAASSTSTASLESTSDALDDLEDEATSTSTYPSVPLQTPTSAFSEDDLAQLKSTYESAQDWLTTKISAQDDLAPFDEPTLLSTDLDRKAEQLNKLMVNILSKQIRIPPKPKTSSKPRSTKVKTAKEVQTSDPASPEASSSAAIKDPLEATFASIPNNQQTEVPEVPEPGSTPVDIRDEL